MENNYKYFAFISFQSSDADYAVKMQHALETYSLPFALSRKLGVPRRFGQCFCYLKDISLREELMMELEEKIAESKYLIVICSPRSAKSTFLNGGIERFIQLGRRDRIIPLIVEGIPYSGDPETECFPEALRRNFPKSSNPFEDHQILGVNIHEEGISSARKSMQRAVVMVVARMLELNFDDLWRRELRRRRERIAVTAVAILTIISSLVLTRQLNKSFDLPVAIVEATPENRYLPQADSVTLVVDLPDDQRSYTIGNMKGVMPNIPASLRNKRIHLTASCNGYFDIDTFVIPSATLKLPLRRNPEIYGHVSAVAVSEKPVANMVINIAGHDVTTDNEGRFSLDIPIEEQRKAYPVFLDGTFIDSIYMPCGTNDVILF